MQFIQGDARDFSFAEPFDAIFSNAVLHWIRPPEAVIRCVRNALRPGGRFVAEFGGRGNVRRMLTVLRETAERMGMKPDLPESYFPELVRIREAVGSVRFGSAVAVLFDRPTPLEGADGLRNWVKMFRGMTLESLPAERREEYLLAVEDAARPDLYDDGGWFADYRRLRSRGVSLVGWIS